MKTAALMPRLKLLGSVVLEDEDGPVQGASARRHPLALLALLACAPARILNRSKLVGLLWPKIAEDQARTRLNSHLYQLRGRLGEDVLVSLGDSLQLDTDVLTCDVVRFREAVGDGRFDRAVELYGGRFLDGFRPPVAAAEGDGELVRSYADTLETWARQMLASAPTEYGEVRSQALLHLALVGAYLGSDEEAVRLADEAVRLYPVARNAFGGPDRVLWQAHVYTAVGRHDDAVDRLRYLLSIPANMVTVPQLRMDLRWDPLRNHPGFQALLREGSG